MHFKETFVEHQGSGLAPGVKCPNTHFKWQFGDKLGWEGSPGLVQPVIDKSALSLPPSASD